MQLQRESLWDCMVKPELGRLVLRTCGEVHLKLNSASCRSCLLPFFMSDFIGMGGIFKYKQINLSLQYGTTLLEPVQMLVLIQVIE